MELQLVVFTAQGQDFGVPIDQVREIIRYSQVTTVPRAPQSVLGVINLRGKVIPVVSLRDRFGFEARDIDDATRIVVSDVAGQSAGFAVDSVTEVLRLAEEDVSSAPATVSTVDSAFIRGIGRIDDRLIILLDLEKVFDFSTLTEVA